MRLFAVWEGECEKCEAKARADREAARHPSYETVQKCIRPLVQEAIDLRPSFPQPTPQDLDFRAAPGGIHNVAYQRAVSACLMFEFHNKQSKDRMEDARKEARQMGHPDLADEILRALDGPPPGGGADTGYSAEATVAVPRAGPPERRPAPEEDGTEQEEGRRSAAHDPAPKSRGGRVLKRKKFSDGE